MTEAQELVYRPSSTWHGRSLENYISLHPKAKGATTFTQAKKMAFGEKQKKTGCKCRQNSCRRDKDGRSEC